MEANIIKTLEWSKCGELLTALAVKAFGHPEEGNITDFAQFVQNFVANGKSFVAFLNKNNKCDFEDSSSIVLVAENACLFSCDPASAVEIIQRHLKILNNGGTVPALWCFLDDERQAVVHFINRKRWYAEAFFYSNHAFSALHLLGNDKALSVLPVVFAADISHYASLAEANGSHVLQEYLPREAFQFLSKKGGKKKGKKDEELLKANNKSFAQKDNGDML